MITKVLQNSELYFTYSNFVFFVGESDLKRFHLLVYDIVMV